MHISIPMVYIILRGCLSSKIIKTSIVRIQRFVKDSGAARLPVAACNIKCERTNTTSNDGYAFYRIYFFTIKSPKAQGGRENEARFF